MQASLLGAACAERASGILLWVVSLEDRESDHELYLNALDYIWSGGRGPGRIVDSSSIEGLAELQVGDEAKFAAAYALNGAIAIYSALQFLETGQSSWVHDCYLTTRSQASFLGRRTSTDLLSGDELSVSRDIDDISRAERPDASLVESLRHRAQADGRVRLDVLIDRYGKGPSKPNFSRFFKAQ